MRLKQFIGALYKTLFSSSRMIDELHWASIFNSTVSSNGWLKENKFSPGRWAVGYNFLYALFRILDEKKPSTILELGLGQTTKMIGQYSTANPDVTHIIIEEDKDWISFFEKGMFTLPSNSTIVQKNYEYIEYKSKANIRAFVDFPQKIDTYKFDLIVIDAPKGSPFFSRIDILKILPQCLAESFVIMMDDGERNGEKETIQEIQESLVNSAIKYAIGTYCGEKDVVVIASDDNKFFCSM